LTQALVRKSVETKSKIAAVVAILDEWQSWSSKGSFLQLLQSLPMRYQNIGPVDTGIGQKTNGKPNPRWWP
jgi:hypothetical protein